MNDPDVVLRVNAYADGHPDIPVVRQRLRPQWVHFEPGRHDHAPPLNGRHLHQRELTEEKRDKKREKGRDEIGITFFFHTTSRKINHGEHGEHGGIKGKNLVVMPEKPHYKYPSQYP